MNIIGDKNYFDINYRYPEEVFVNIKEYDGIYKISNYGRIMIVKHKHTRRTLPFIRIPDLSRKYPSISLSDRKHYSIHVIVATYFVENPNKYPMVNHLDGNKLNNFYKNLEWCTCSQNTIHAYENGLRKSITGEKHHFAKHTETDIIKIYKYLESGCSKAFITKTCKITYSGIYHLIYGNSWKYLNLDFGQFVIKRK